MLTAECPNYGALLYKEVGFRWLLLYHSEYASVAVLNILERIFCTGGVMKSKLKLDFEIFGSRNRACFQGRRVASLCEPQGSKIDQIKSSCWESHSTNFLCAVGLFCI